MHSIVDNPTAWGRESVSLDLPFGPLCMAGLTARQRSDIIAAYRFFIDDQTSAVAPPHTACQAYRLDRPMEVELESLTVDGHYCPRKTRAATGIEVTGFEFLAHMRLDRKPATTSLGVAREEDLANPVVIENFLRIFTAHQALIAGGAMLHSAGLLLDNRAYIFVGRSGAGKSTLARKAHEAGAKILSDDINLLLPADGGFNAHALPFMGEFGPLLTKLERGAYPVAGIIFLEQGRNLQAQAVRQSAAVAQLLVGCPFVNTDEAESDGLLDILSGISQAVPVIRLASRRDSTVESIMRTVRECMANA